jgi:hypothetical protein
MKSLIMGKRSIFCGRLYFEIFTYFLSNFIVKVINFCETLKILWKE